ncbi:hypothetical protein [Pleomorphomonas sp. PLEO]|uniref:hypothetical protein n=1 Tax=Pleomorphomonas sp. PLEO TaxID=3239306 RepID=UPI00351DCAAE
MLEDFATNYVIQGPTQLVGTYIILMGLGAIASVVFPNPNAFIARAPYFFGSAFGLFLVSLVHLPAIWTPRAIEAGLAWTLILPSWLAWLAFGFGLGRLAAARSRDAFGHARGAILAFIPFGNLWLQFRRSRGNAPRTVWLTRGFVGVLAGFVLFGLTHAAMYEMGYQRMRAFIADLNVPRDVFTQFMINNIGLEETLVFIAEGLDPPLQVDVATTLVSATAEGTTLTSTYRVAGIMKLLGIRRDDMVKGLCSTPFNAPLLRAGATLVHIYYDADGQEMVRAGVRADDCGLAPTISFWSKLPALSFSQPETPAQGPTAQMPPQGKAPDLAQGPARDGLAVRLIVQDNWLIRLVGFGFAVLGGAVSALLFVSTSRMARPAYVLGNGVILVLAVLAEAALIPVPGVLDTGAINVRFLIWAFVQFSCGFALWRLAAARSRDALGHALAGALAFIPLANLWLMLAPPKEEPGAVVRIRLAGAPRAGLSVLAGLGCVALAWLLAQEADRRIRVAIIEGEVLPVSDQMRYLVNNEGMERTLEYLSHLTVSSARIDERLVLQKVEAAGAVLTRTVSLAGIEQASPTMLTRTARKNICSDEGYLALLDAGATIREVYRGRLGIDLGSVAMKAGDCKR